MGHAAAFLKKFGQACTIQRTPTVDSFVSLKRSGQSSDPGVADSLWKGLILAESALVSGDLFTMGAGLYLVQTVMPDPVSGELGIAVALTNATVTIQRKTVSVDDDGNRVQSWTDVAVAEPVFGQIVTTRMRSEDPGLLDQARYLFQVRKSLGVVVLDRVVYGGHNYQVEAMDDIGMPGVVRLQLGVDVR